MNKKDPQAKFAAALNLCGSSSNSVQKETLLIDIWIERPGVLMPLFADYMTKEYWQNPGELPE